MIVSGCGDEMSTPGKEAATQLSPVVDAFESADPEVACSKNNSKDRGIREGWAKWIAVVDAERSPADVAQSAAAELDLSLTETSTPKDAVAGTHRLYAEKTDGHPDRYLEILYGTSVRADCTTLPFTAAPSVEQVTDAPPQRVVVAITSRVSYPFG